MRFSVVIDPVPTHAPPHLTIVVVILILTEAWHMAHLLASYVRCTIPGSPMGRSERLSRRLAGWVLRARNTKKNAPLHPSRALVVVLP